MSEIATDDEKREFARRWKAASYQILGVVEDERTLREMDARDCPNEKYAAVAAANMAHAQAVAAKIGDSAPLSDASLRAVGWHVPAREDGAIAAQDGRG